MWKIILSSVGIGNMKYTIFAQPPIIWIIDAVLPVRDMYRPKMSPRNHLITFSESQHHVVNPTYFCRTLNDRIQHRLPVRVRVWQ